MFMSPMHRSNPVRMMGLSSGMDTDNLIQQMMRAHQMRIDNKMRSRTILQWRQESHNNLANQIKSFRSSFMTALGSTGMFNRNMYNPVVATFGGGKNDSAVTIRTAAGSSTGTMRIGQVVSLAKGASVTTNGADGVGVTGAGQAGLALTTRLGEIKDGAIQFGRDKYTLTLEKDADGKATNTIDLYRFPDGKYSYDEAGDNLVQFDINGKGTITKDGESIDVYMLKNGNLVREGTQYVDGNASGTIGDDKTYTIRRDGEGNYFYKIGDGAEQKFTFGANGKATISVDGDSIDIFELDDNKGIVIGGGTFEGTLTYGTAKITINSKEVTLNRNMTIQNMLNAVNGTEGINATMSYDRLTDKFTLESKTIGEKSTLDFSSDTSNFFNTLGLNQINRENGTMAKVYIQGELVTKDTNTFSHRGVTITLNHATDTGSTGGTSTHEDDIIVTLKNDVTDTIDRIKNAIDAFNSILKNIDDMLKSRKDVNERGYQPLTDEEKSLMTEKQVEDWEAIARKGIMRSDPSLQLLMRRLRDGKDGIIIPAVRSLSTGSEYPYLGLKDGQITIDEDMLKRALEEDPDKVAEFFVGTGTRNQDGEIEGLGLFRAFDEKLRDFVNVNQVRTIKSLEDSMRQTNLQMEKLTLKMYAEEDKLYRQFAAMETALSKLQQQGDWMTSMLGGQGQGR